MDNSRQCEKALSTDANQPTITVLPFISGQFSGQFGGQFTGQFGGQLGGQLFENFKNNSGDNLRLFRRQLQGSLFYNSIDIFKDNF